MTQSRKKSPTPQADRSKAMRSRLTEAAISALVDVGYARTTSVEVCARAGVTRGALFHHFEDLPALLVAAMEDVYQRMFAADRQQKEITPLDEWIGIVWDKVSQREFKAVIELWLAARNDPEIAPVLQPAIDTYKQIFTPERSDRLMEILGSDRKVLAFYRMAMECMIGLALGRATTPQGSALDHEDMVVSELQRQARIISTHA